jgi:Bacterial Ig-like domain (group 1)
LSSDQTDLKVGELASLEASLKDASGNPIGGDAVAFTLSGPGRFDNEGAAYNTVLRPDGKALVRVKATQAGTIVARAAALNTIDSLTLRFTNNTLSLSAGKSALAVGGNDSTLITATYVNGSGAPVGGASIAFAANAGAISTPNATTDGSGKAATWFKSATFSGTAIVQANGPAGNAQIRIEFQAGSAKSVKLSVTADNIAVNGGIANLSAKVSDAQGNLVSGQPVNFKIIQGPGGGESILKPLAVSQAGIAQSQLAAGSVASGYRGVLVVATAGTVSDTSKLTISGPAQIVTVSRPQDDSVPVENGGILDETTFEFFVGAVVQDVNGNMVADGTEVHFSAAVSGAAYQTRIFDHWNGLGGTLESVKPVYRAIYHDVPFEDINNNAKFDAGIDLDLDGDASVLRRGEDVNGDGKFDWLPATHDFWFDFNGNGRCDPDVGEDDTVVVSGKTLYADLNANGFRDRSEIISDNAPLGVCNEPVSGDFPYLRREVRDFLPVLPFYSNDYAVAIEVSAVTKNGVAHARLRYPRQFARRLFVNVNAEANGVRDRDGERFILPVVGK